MEKRIKQLLNELLGVPDNVINIGNDIYFKILEVIKGESTFQKTFFIDGEYMIGDHRFNGVQIIFNFINVSSEEPIMKDNKVVLAGFAFKSQATLDDKLYLKTTNLSHPTIQINLGIRNDTAIDDIKKTFETEKTLICSSLTHELKHYYDHIKKPNSNLKSMAKYAAMIGASFLGIEPFSRFLHISYFIHSIENLVRPSEFASNLYNNDVTQKEFKNFLLNSDTYKMLKEANEFSYEKLKKDIEPYLDEIKNKLIKRGISREQLDSKDDFSDFVLELFYINMTNWKMDNMINYLGGFFAFEDDENREKYMDKFDKEITKYQNNPKNFFKNEEKRFKFIATKMMKKLAKLYALARRDMNENIINPEIWYRYFVKEVEIETQIKRPRK